MLSAEIKYHTYYSRYKVLVTLIDMVFQKMQIFAHILDHISQILFLHAYLRAFLTPFQRKMAEVKTRVRYPKVPCYSGNQLILKWEKNSQTLKLMFSWSLMLCLFRGAAHTQVTTQNVNLRYVFDPPTHPPMVTKI